MGLMALEDSTFREGGLENLGCRPVPQIFAFAPEQVESVEPGLATPEQQVFELRLTWRSRHTISPSRIADRALRTLLTIPPITRLTV